jgi:hypothetical protein
MKKAITIVLLAYLLISLFAFIGYAATETIEWGYQFFSQGTSLAKIDVGNSVITEVTHTFDNVGYTYLNATCSQTGAFFSVTIQKKGFLGIWFDQQTFNNTHFGYNIEWGAGGNYGSGKYRFQLTPYNNQVALSGGTISYAPILIQDFYSKSNP